MKSSRNRFAEFREKVRKGLLDKDRQGDASKTPQLSGPGTAGPRMGGHHGGGPGGGMGMGKGGGDPNYVLKKPKKKLFAEYRVMLKGYYPAVGMLLLYGFINALLALITPLTLKILVDDIAPGHSLRDSSIFKFIHFPAGLLPGKARSSLYAVIALLIATAVLAIVIQWLQLLAQQRIIYRLAGSLRQRLHEHLARLPLSLLSDYKTGGVVSRILSDSDQVVGGVQNAIVNPFNALVRILLTLTLIVIAEPHLSLGAAFFIPPIIVIHYLLFRRLRPMWRNIQDDRSLLSARLTDTYGGIRVVRSFRREPTEYKEFGAAQNTMIRKQQYTAIIARLLQTGWMVFTPAVGIFIIWYGGLRLLEIDPATGKPLTSIGALIMFQTLVIQLIQPITTFIDSLQNLQQNLGALDRVVDVLEQKIDMPDREGAIGVRNVEGNITFRDLRFGYKPDRLVLDGINMEVPAGTTLAIVGPSGSGKTTLVNLVARFFDAGSGAIELDGRDIRDYRLNDYRSLFAMVLQDVYLFDGTVMENIAYGKRHATPEEIIKAAKKANAHAFIMELDKGYDTIVGERGNKLSGGQKQRLSIARAILADPKILILDEATSSLDSHSEHLIQESLKDLMANRTTFVIAHRLSTIIHADRIVVLVDGRIVESGTHDELMEKGGVYNVMFTQQFERHRDPALERIEWETANGVERKAS